MLIGKRRQSRRHMLAVEDLDQRKDLTLLSIQTLLQPPFPHLTSINNNFYMLSMTIVKFMAVLDCWSYLLTVVYLLLFIYLLNEQSVHGHTEM